MVLTNTLREGDKLFVDNSSNGEREGPMENYLGQIEGWMEQVRDDQTSVEDYDFLDRVSHGGPEHNGSKGLANVGAYLAIYEEDGETKIEEDLIEELDRRQNSETSRRKRFRNIVHDAQTDKREGNTLKDREIDGHGRLQNMIDEFRSNVEPQPVKGDKHMTEDNEDNDYSRAIETIDTIGGIGLALGTGIINVPVTALGVGVKHLQSDEAETEGTEIDVQEELSEDDQNDISGERDFNMKGQKDGYRVEGQDEELYSENLEDQKLQHGIELTFGDGAVYGEPAELAVAAQEGEVEPDRFMEIASSYDLEEDQEAYLAGTGVRLLAEQRAEELEAASEKMVDEKHIVDDVFESVLEELDGREEVYIDHMDEMTSGFRDVYDSNTSALGNVEYARRNLEGLVREGAEAVRDSNVDGLRDLESSINDALSDN